MEHGNRRRALFAALLAVAAVVVGLFMSSASADAGDGSATVVWTGNGVSGGVGGSTCDSTSSDLLSPVPAGQKGWLFVLQQISGDPTDWRLDVNFSGTADDQTNILPVQTTNSVVKWAVYSTAGASLDGATAYATGTGGTSTGQLTVSHCFGAGKAKPKIATDASGAGFTGDALSDTAHLTEGTSSPAITGTITFKLYGPGDSTCATALYTENVNVNGNGDYTTDGDGSPAGGNVAQTAGTYQWVASYSGDNLNEAVGPTGCNDAREANVVEAAAPTVVTAIHLEPETNPATVVTTIDLGHAVHDSATVTGPAALGIPTGSVDFTFYKGTCVDEESPVLFTDNVALVNGVAVPSKSTGALGAGDYHYLAHYNSGDVNKWTGSDSLCEPLTVNKAQLDAATTLHAPNHTVIADGAELVLGSKVHDTAQITGNVAGFSTGAVTFTYYASYTACNIGGAAIGNDGTELNGDAKSVETAALAPGSYAFQATVAGNGNYLGDTSACEPFTVKKDDLTIRTDIHNYLHQIVTSVLNGSTVHDTATLGSTTTGFNPVLANVSFTFYNTINCTGTGTSAGNAGSEGTLIAKSGPEGPLGSGAYSFSASFTGDDNYNPAGPATCEPLSVRTFGKTMGFWGNNNGVARIIANGGYAANSVTIGRGAVVDTQAEAAKILPNQLNACGKGTPLIFTVGAQTANAACTVAAGVNANSLNTLSGQTLALGYNIKLVTGFTGQQIGALGCTPVNGLSNTSTVNDAFNTAVSLINGSAAGGTTTQSQIGLMNTLLGCVNAEA